MKLIRILLALLLFSTQAYSHGDEDHGAKTIAVSAIGSFFTVNAVSDKFELVLRYEPIEAKQDAHFQLFISDFATNRPVDSAQLNITCLELPDLKFISSHQSTGQYLIEGAFPENKSYTLAVRVASPGKADLIALSGIEVGKKLPVAEAETTESSGFDWKMLLMLAAGIVLGVALAWFIIRKRLVRPTPAAVLLFLFLTIPQAVDQPLFAHGDEDHGAAKKPASSTTGSTNPNEIDLPKESQFLFEIRTSFALMSSFAPVLELNGRVAPVTGGEALIIAPLSGSIKSLTAQIGQQVRKGQVLAIVDQTISATEQLGISTGAAAARAELESARKEYQRLQSIADIAPRKEVQQAEIRYRQAQANAGIYRSPAKRTSLVSPINGVLDNFSLSVGQQVAQGQELFRVVNKERLKVEALVYGADRDKIPANARFQVQDEQGRILSDSARMLTLGSTVDPTNQSVQLILEIDNRNGKAIPGQIARVSISGRSTSRVLTVPTESLTDINGKPAVFVHTAPEKFEAKYVQPGISDARFTVIQKGLSERERVVSQNVYQVKAALQSK